MYAGTLTAVLVLPAFTKPIETLTDLLLATRRGDLNPAVVEGTSNAFLFKVCYYYLSLSFSLFIFLSLSIYLLNQSLNERPLCVNT